MIPALIVDDEKLAIRRMEIKLNRYKDIEIIGRCSDGDSAISGFRTKQPELAFLDINMPGTNGLDVAEIAADLGIYVIFVTAFHQYAVKAFELLAVDYLLKPVSTDRLDLALDQFRQRRCERNSLEQVNELRSVLAQLRSNSEDVTYPSRFFWMKDNGISRRISLDDIEWIEAARDYVSLHMKSGKSFFTRNTMTNFEKLVDPSFFLRVHRSAIVNLTQIVKTDQRNGVLKLYLRSGTEVRVGRVFKAEAKLRLHSLASMALSG